MTKKHINPDTLANELRGQSAFFPASPTAAREPQAIPERRAAPAGQKASKHASTLAQPAPSLIEDIRRSVKQVGKEVTFVRLLPEEKRKLAEIAYSYKRQGIKTSENEIARIGIDFLLEDYQAHGKASILAMVIEALNA